MAVKQLPVIPPSAPGEGVAKLLKRMELIERSDPVNFNGDTSVNLFEVPGNILITEIQVNVITAFEASGASAAATGTITVPGDTGAITVWNAANVALQAAGTGGYSPDTAAGFIKTPDSGGFVIFLLDPSTSTVGQAEVFMKYVPNVDVL